MFEGIEFTDRYGGHPPSGLRGCFKCEAMGCNPVELTGLPPDTPFDDCWTFKPCAACNGTGRVSWIVTLARVPRWLVTGIPFVWRYGVRREFNSEGGRWESLRIALWARYGMDLKTLRR
jgi:hypothetical protein